jgi:hypothetical protein
MGVGVGIGAGISAFLQAEKRHKNPRIMAVQLLKFLKDVILNG